MERDQVDSRVVTHVQRGRFLYLNGSGQECPLNTGYAWI